MTEKSSSPISAPVYPTHRPWSGKPMYIVRSCLSAEAFRPIRRSRADSSGSPFSVNDPSAPVINIDAIRKQWPVLVSVMAHSSRPNWPADPWPKVINGNMEGFPATGGARPLFAAGISNPAGLDDRDSIKETPPVLDQRDPFGNRNGSHFDIPPSKKLRQNDH